MGQLRFARVVERDCATRRVNRKVGRATYLSADSASHVSCLLPVDVRTTGSSFCPLGQRSSPVMQPSASSVSGTISGCRARPTGCGSMSEPPARIRCSASGPSATGGCESATSRRKYSCDNSGESAAAAITWRASIPLPDSCSAVCSAARCRSSANRLGARSATEMDCAKRKLGSLMKRTKTLIIESGCRSFQRHRKCSSVRRVP